LKLGLLLSAQIEIEKLSELNLALNRNCSGNCPKIKIWPRPSEIGNETQPITKYSSWPLGIVNHRMLTLNGKHNSIIHIGRFKLRLWETFRQREIICKYVPSEIPELNGNERQ